MLSRALQEQRHLRGPPWGGGLGGCRGRMSPPSRASLGPRPEPILLQQGPPVPGKVTGLPHSPPSHPLPRLGLCLGKQPSLIVFCSLHSSQLVCDSGKGYYYHSLTC